MVSEARMPGWGEEASRILQRTLEVERDFPTQGGKPTLILFFGSAAHPEVRRALELVARSRALFDDIDATFYGVTVDADDERRGRIAQQLPGIRYFADYDRTVSRRFDVIDDEGGYSPCWLLLDRTWRVAGSFFLTQGEAAIAALRQLIADAPGPDWAPVMMIPHVLEPALCCELIDRHRASNDAAGVMRQIGDETRLVFDANSKIRRDHYIHQGDLAVQLVARLKHRLGPMIKRCFQ